MKSCGVIVEYNPFHNGHLYHLKEARRKSGADVVVAVMSGNFLQRGEPAILDKWTRAELALQHGADLVIELPFAYACQAADIFARGAVELLQDLGVDELCFGVEDGEREDYESFASQLATMEAQVEAQFATYKNDGRSYASQMSEVYQSIFPEMKISFSSPNNILGIAYAKANARGRYKMGLIPLCREKTGYHDTELIDSQFASATAIRKELFNPSSATALTQVMPEKSYQAVITQDLVEMELFWPLIKYRILTASLNDLRDIYQVTEGIEYRLKECAGASESLAEFMTQVKSKRTTWVHLQRMCVYILLNVTDKEMRQVLIGTQYLRLLGFNEQGQAFLGQRKKTIEKPIIARVSKENRDLLNLDIRAGEVYQLGSKHQTQQDFYRKPIMLTK